MLSYSIVFPEKLKVEIVKENIPGPGNGQVLCKAEKSLISIGTEMRCLRGEVDSGTNWSEWVKYPFKPGYCTTGTVVAAAGDVTGFKPGDRVVTMQTHSQYFIDNASNLIKIPDGISFEEAVWQPLGVITQIGARRSELKLGETVGVIGLGIMGQLLTQYLKLLGARKILALDISTARLKIASENGATDCLNIDVKDAKEAIRNLTGGKMLDVVYDVTGLPHILSFATQLVRRMGKVILLGDNTMPSRQFLGPNVVSDSVSILGIHGSMCPAVGNEFNPWTWNEMAYLFFDFITRGKISIKPLISRLVSPMEAPEIYRWINNDRPDALGVLFDWSLLKDERS